MVNLFTFPPPLIPGIQELSRVFSCHQGGVLYAHIDTFFLLFFFFFFYFCFVNFLHFCSSGGRGGRRRRRLRSCCPQLSNFFQNISKYFKNGETTTRCGHTASTSISCSEAYPSDTPFGFSWVCGHERLGSLFPTARWWWHQRTLWPGPSMGFPPLLL